MNVGRPRQAFGDLLRRFRADAGLTQDELALKTQISVRALSDLERGVRRSPYPTTIRRLADALGLSEQAKAELRTALGETDQPTPVEMSDVAWRDNLPAEVSSFVGRKADLEQLQLVLPTTRLLTLVGPGGVGKTRLALRLAAAQIQQYADGVWYVGLDVDADPVGVAKTVAVSLGVPNAAGATRADTLADWLGQRELLLVLDNCGHIVTACAELVSQLLRLCRGLRVLVTSHVTLGIAGETVWPVTPLEVPEPYSDESTMIAGSAAVQLFVERAAAVCPEFALDDASALGVAELCRRLDGLPLAIELAAAWMRFLSPNELLARLEERPDLLRGTLDAPNRQRTLHSTVEWSAQFLADDERRLLERMGVFDSSATLTEIELVCADELLPSAMVVRALTRLVEASLVTCSSQRGAEPRFDLLAATREYARAQLRERGEMAAVQAKYAACRAN